MTACVLQKDGSSLFDELVENICFKCISDISQMSIKI